MLPFLLGGSHKRGERKHLQCCKCVKLLLCFSLMLKSQLFHWLNHNKKRLFTSKAPKALQSENLKYTGEEFVSEIHRSCAAAALFFRDVRLGKELQRRNTLRNQVQEAL